MPRVLCILIVLWLLLCVTTLSGCVPILIRHDPAPPPIPIDNFSQVDDGIYRGAQPTSAGLQYLKDLGVKMIIDLNDDSEDEIAEELGTSIIGLKLRYSPMPGFWAPPVRNVARVEAMLKDKANYPIFVHCEYGKDRTGLVIALHRVWHDHWKQEDAYREWMAHGHSQVLFTMDIFFWDHKIPLD